jgi:hypothetical protein
MPPPPKATLQELKESILSLVLACPFDGTKPPDCPLSKVRQLSLRTRFEWVNGLNLEEAEGLWATHEKCLMAKEIKKSR